MSDRRGRILRDCLIQHLNTTIIVQLSCKARTKFINAMNINSVVCKAMS